MAKTTDRAAFEQMDAFGVGDPNPFGTYFSGESFLKMLTPQGYPLGAFNVTFEPGCRNNWHVHHASEGGGQLLICTAGEGWYQEWGKPARSLSLGDVVAIPANVKHWHGAKANSWFSHIGIEVPGADASTEWLEPVSGEDYDTLA